MTQHKEREGPLEGSADLTFTVPIIKVARLASAIMPLFPLLMIASPAEKSYEKTQSQKRCTPSTNSRKAKGFTRRAEDEADILKREDSCDS